MSFSDALKYPFNNFFRVMQIVLFFAIFIAALVTTAFNTGDWDLILGLSLIITLAQALMLSGYSIRIIRGLMRNHENKEYLPPFEFIKDCGRGFLVTLATIIYMIPAFIVSVCAMMAVMSTISSSRYSYGTGSSMPVSGEMIDSSIFALIFLLPFFVFPIMALLVGMMRYAAEERSSALFETGKNWKIVTGNMALMRGLIIRQFGMWVLFFILTNISEFIYAAVINELPVSDTPQSTFVMLTVIGFIIGTTISIFHQFSSTHLIAQRAEALGIGGRKPFDTFDGDEEKIKRHQPEINIPRPTIRSI
ncbi:MAG: DUF4013 domain-containing protein [Aggregatilineales bacterium]